MPDAMEIDTNLQIIQLVQGRPTLYSKGNDFRGRTLHWKQIAAILKIEVPWVKSRWHLLRSMFLEEYLAHLNGKQSAFKYFNDMCFLVNHVDIDAFKLYSKHNEIKSQPEFMIEKKDLEGESDEDSSNIFIELDLEENDSKQIIQMSQSLEIGEGDIEETLFTSHNEYSENQQLRKTPEYGLDSQVQSFQILEAGAIEKENAESEIKELEEEPEAKSKSRNVYGATVKNDTHMETTKTQPQVPLKKEMNNIFGEKHRCEDAIFGELVAATLRRMDYEKKKSIKREIMNILFT